MYKKFKDEFEEIENPTLKELEEIELQDVYGIRISNNTDSDLPYLFKNTDFPLKEENISSYRWFKHKISGGEYKTLVTNSSGLFEKIEYDKAIEFIKRYSGLYILESEQHEKVIKNEYSPYKKGSIKTDITNIDNGGELSAYIKVDYHNLYIMYLLEQKIDHDSIVQINADEAAFLISLNLPLEIIYAYDGTDITIISKSSGGYLFQNQPIYKKSNIDKARGRVQIKSILDTKYKNCKFFRYTDMPDIKTNHINGYQYIKIDSKYAVDFIKSGKDVLKLDENNSISTIYFLSKDKKYISWYDDGRACNVDLSRDLPKHLFVNRKDYYDYISLVIKKISGNEQEEKLAHINCPDYKLIISTFNKLDIETKKKLYNSICEMAHKFDDFYDFYISKYRSDENKLKVTRFDDLPLFMFAGFYKIYTDNVNNLKYFTKMIEDLYRLMIIDNDTDINALIISFMENKDNDKECYLDKNDSHDSEIYFNQLEFISVDFADFLKNELFVELKKVDPNIISNIKTSKIFESNTTISSDEIKEASGVYDISYIEKCISDMVKTDMVKTSYSCCDSNYNKYQTPVHSSTEQDNKIQLYIQLSEEEMIHIYYDIIGKYHILSPKELHLHYRRDKINDVLYNLKNTKLKEKLEFILNSNMDILRSFKYSDDNIVNEISKALNGFAIISDIYIRNIIIFIIRNLYNKYIYINKLPSIIDICIKYQNKIQDETIDNAIFSYIFDRKPARFLGKIIDDYYNRDDDEIDNIEYYRDFMKDCFGIKWDEN